MKQWIVTVQTTTALLQIRSIRRTMYCSPPSIHPPFFTLFSVYIGRDFYSNVSDYTPHKLADTRLKKVQLDFAVSRTEEQQQCWSCTMWIFPSLLVIFTEERQQDHLLCHWWQETSRSLDCSDVCPCLQGKRNLDCTQQSYRVLHSSFLKGSR